MSKKYMEAESPSDTLKNESARQRWELFHRAIAHAKQSNADALANSDLGSGNAKHGRSLLSIVR